MDTPCLNEATGVGDHHFTHILTSDKRLVGQAQVRKRFVHRDVERMANRTA